MYGYNREKLHTYRGFKGLSATSIVIPQHSLSRRARNFGFSERDDILVSQTILKNNCF